MNLDSVLQLSWLERHTDNVEVGSSTLPGTTEEKEKFKKEKGEMLRKVNFLISHFCFFISIRGISSAGQSTCFARRGSTVRIRYSPLLGLDIKLFDFNRSLTYCTNLQANKGKHIFIKYKSLSIFCLLLNVVQWQKVIKGVRWMPRLLQAMKDVISCDKSWGGANIL